MADFGACYVYEEDPLALAELAGRAEGLGYSHLWLADSQILWLDIYVCFGLCAAQTRTIQLGTMVTNPVTRHPTVTAGAAATLQLVSDGRFHLGIGRGDSAVRTLGTKPSTLAELQNAVRLIDALCRGEEVKYGSVAIQLRWAGERVPIHIAGYGPKILEWAGATADGAILQIADPAIVKWCVGHILRGITKAGRDRKEVKIICAAPVYVSDDRAHALDMVRSFPAVVSNHVLDLLTRYDVADLPPELTERVDKRGSYDYMHHGQKDADHVAFATDAMVERFTIAGSAKACIQKIEELIAIGIDHFCFYVTYDRRETTEAVGRQVLPHFL